MSESIRHRHENVDAPQQIIAHCQQWVDRVIVRLNICPFAKAEVQAQTIHYVVNDAVLQDELVAATLQQCQELDECDDRATTLIILNDPSLGFYRYLDVVDAVEQALLDAGYEGIYQVASFHPDYCFGGSEPDDASNFTNRSPYPMIHLIREHDITNALANFLRPESIPDRNIEYTRRKGFEHMKSLLSSCYDIDNTKK